MSKSRTITKSVFKTVLVLASSSLLSLSFMYPVSVQAADVWNLDATTNYIYNTNTSNVGIGLTNPPQKLSVRGASNGVASFSDGSTYPCCSSYYTVAINEVGPNRPTLQFHDSGVAEGQIVLTNNTGYGQRGFNFQSSQAPASAKFTGDIISESATNAVLRLVKTGTTNEQFKLYNAGGGSNIVSDKALYMYAGDGTGVNGTGNAVLVAANTFFNNSAGLSKAKISTNGGTTYFNDGNVGVGTTTPDSSAKLDVAGKLKTGSVQITSGAATGNVLTSDANGNATWQTPASSSTIADKSVTVSKIATAGVGWGKVLRSDATGGAFWSLVGVNSLSSTQGITTTFSGADNNEALVKLTDGGVSTNKLADGAVTVAKLSGGVPPAGKILSYNGTNLQWIDQATGSSNGNTQWLNNNYGIHYDSNVGVGAASDPNYKLTVRGKLNVEGTDIVFGRNNGRDSGARTENRALVHESGDKLVINYNQDFEGGVFIDGNTRIQGELRAKKIMVMPDVNADYVFKPGYYMKTLAEVEKFIKENGHLPGVPNDKEVYENGVELSRGYTILLEKIEELHLRAIDQEKRIDKQQAQIDQLIEQNKLIMEKLNK